MSMSVALIHNMIVAFTKFFILKISYTIYGKVISMVRNYLSW